MSIYTVFLCFMWSNCKKRFAFKVRFNYNEPETIFCLCNHIFFYFKHPNAHPNCKHSPQKASFAGYTLVMLKEIVLKLIIFALNERQESFQDLKTCSPASMSIINIKFVSFLRHKNLALKQEWVYVFIFMHCMWVLYLTGPWQAAAPSLKVPERQWHPVRPVQTHIKHLLLLFTIK